MNRHATTPADPASSGRASGPNRRAMLASAVTLPAVAVGILPASAAVATPDPAFAVAHAAALAARKASYDAIDAAWNGTQDSADQEAHRERACAASRAANRNLTNTPARTIDGIAAKLRYAWIGDNDFDQPIVKSAMDDAERLAAPIGAGQGEVDADIETPVARLHSMIEALGARLDATDSNNDDCPAYQDLTERLWAAEKAMAETPALTLHDMALKIWTVRSEIFNSGDVEAAIVTDAARIVGPHAERQVDAMKAERERFERRSDAMRAAFGPDLEALMALPLAQRPAAVLAAGIPA